MPRRHLTRFAWLSIATAVLTISLKAIAYLITGSVGLLSDALESGVNLATAIFALIVLTIAAQPPDEDHEYGHGKIEYFSSGVEGTLIVLAAVTIGVTAVRSLIAPRPLEQLGVGLAISVVAALCNWGTAHILLRAGRHYQSVTLQAEAQHLLTDVWTSAGVVLGVGAVMLTSWQPLDALIALAVAARIVYAGVRLLHQGVNGLMDVSLPLAEREQVVKILERYRGQQVQYHALRTRQSGAQRFISVHIQVPGAWSVQQGHELLEEIERDLREAVAPVYVLTHLEPIEDPTSWRDIPLDRDDS